ncbi:hypothetical protein NDU88_007366 [Pleurodeles waltl]|uniref:Uncharacterized protein n=1 Tax=Pleurodeles waltl TaxID=8319 RepID=A0AAV7QKN2_PLEWA|nr:hypothetical protein NDU88_007366 [Pleurodeles waltl]
MEDGATRSGVPRPIGPSERPESAVSGKGGTRGGRHCLAGPPPELAIPPLSPSPSLLCRRHSMLLEEPRGRTKESALC